MGDYGLSSDLRQVVVLARLKELQLTGCGEMGHMQPRVMLQRQLHSQRGTAIAGFLVADDEMETDIGIVATDEFETLHILGDDAGVLAMGHQRQV